ncbi:hypothetical protein E2320_021816 [Naja naja]|nr:hypothetical protein E2320_021816 [Naja naja]
MTVPSQPLGHGWMSHEDLRDRGPQGIPSDHAPLSPQSSVASSGSGGSEHLEDPSTRNTFQEEGSGMKDVPAWLKSLRLHKYAALFSQMTYDEMMSLTECHLEAQNVTKGARHKIVISIQKLKERQNLLKSLERVSSLDRLSDLSYASSIGVSLILKLGSKLWHVGMVQDLRCSRVGLFCYLQDILEGGNLRLPLQELHQMILTPIKAYASRNLSVDEHTSHFHRPTSLIGSDNPGLDCKDSASGGMQHHSLPGCEGETGGVPLPEGDIPGQFTKVMGKAEVLASQTPYRQLDLQVQEWAEETHANSKFPLEISPLHGWDFWVPVAS